MAEFDAFLDTLLQQRNSPQVTYIDDNDANTIKLKQTTSHGQGVFAERFLPVDEPICALNCPTVTAIDADFLPTTCYHCLVVTTNNLPIPGYGFPALDLKTCNGCHVARFCNKDCQVRAWHAYHKYECKIFKNLTTNLPPAIFRAVLRMVLLKDRDLLPEEEWTRITSLVAHEHLLAGGHRSNITEMAEGIKLLAESSLSVTMIQKLIFIMKFNAIELPTPIYGGIGVMLLPLIGKINHSCEPNLAVHRPQHTMVSGWLHSAQMSEGDRNTFVQIVPLRNIERGEEILNCYVTPTDSAIARRAKLLEDYFFDCTCARCLTDIRGASDISKEQPGLTIQFAQWTRDMRRHISQSESNHAAFRNAAVCMDKFERFSAYPALYSTGEFPQLASMIVLKGLKAKALDVSIVDLFRIYFFVNPERFVGQYNPTNVYTVFLLIDILDVLLRISTAPGFTAEVTEDFLKALSSQGISKRSLFHWRCRMVDDLRVRIRQSALKDLEKLLDKRREQICCLCNPGEAVEEVDVKESAEQEMRAVLKLKQSSWELVLRRVGC